MASSILFRLKSIADTQGIRETTAGFSQVLGVVGKLGVSAAKVALSFRFLE